MSDQEALVTVFRSAEPSALDEAGAVLDLLVDAGFNPAIYTDAHPGVPEGAVEVRVPATEEAASLAVIEEATAAPGSLGDSSAAMDLVEVYQGSGTTGEMEAMSVRSVLDANHIPSVVVGTPELPNLPFSVKVPLAFEYQALQTLEEAKAAGPAAADAEAEAEAEAEAQANQ
jgi:hypothetical protein